MVNDEDRLTESLLDKIVDFLAFLFRLGVLFDPKKIPHGQTTTSGLRCCYDLSASWMGVSRKSIYLDLDSH